MSCYPGNCDWLIISKSRPLLSLFMSIFLSKQYFLFIYFRYSLSSSSSSLELSLKFIDGCIFFQKKKRLIKPAKNKL